MAGGLGMRLVLALHEVTQTALKESSIEVTLSVSLH